jgi:short-subunit dehydrogenase
VSVERNGSEGGKVVLVTGASAGIGLAVAREAARRGYRLALTARRAGRLERLVAEFEDLAVEAAAIPAALDDADAAERIVSETLARFGRLDALVNNAGFGLPTLFAESEPDELRRQVEVNFTAPLMLARHALPALLESRGVIINVGSAITAVANSGLGAYGSTKAGLAYWSLALRREVLHRGVQVCLVEPGPVKTEFFDAFTKLGPEPGVYHPMLDAPAPWMSAPVDDVARRIVGLIERPRRRLSVRKRFVWPWRVVGTLFQVWPWLGDAAVSTLVKYYEGVGPRSVDPSRSEQEPARAE